MITQKKRLTGIVLTVAFILLIPFTAMQFTREVNWALSDFAVAGVLLLGTGLACEVIIRKISNKKYRLAICAVVLFALILFWLELAVGIFGSPVAGS
jgi:hypothetical protein